MKIKICSRSILEKMSGSGFEPRTAVINIKFLSGIIDPIISTEYP